MLYLWRPKINKTLLTLFKTFMLRLSDWFPVLSAVLLIALLVLPDALRAQVTVHLDSIEVTSSRISTEISESGKHVSVITPAEIRQMPVSSVDELLRTLPGVNINSRNAFGVQADVGIRGSTFSQVLFMLDNVPLNDPLTAHFNTNIPVSLSEIGQIELIRGPASASYGADAVGGVVHIKTKTYMERETRRTDNRLSYATADLGAGQNGLLSGDLATELQGERWRLSTSARTIRSDGERLRNPGFEAGVSDDEFYNNYFEVSNLSASLSYRLADNWSAYVRGGADERDFSARYFYTRSETDEAEEQISSRWILSSLTRDSGNHRTELNTSWRRVADRFDFNSGLGVPVNEHTTGLFFLNLSHQMTTDRFGAGSSRLMAGVQAANQQIESTDRGDHNEWMGGVYLIGQTRPADRLNITASSRLEFDPQHRAEFLPQLSASYRLGDVTLRGSAGRAIRLGDFTERYISSQIPELTPGRNIGNPDLQPERSWSFDAGGDWNPSAGTRFSGTAFFRTSTNLIDYTLTPSSDIQNADNLQADAEYFYARNISSARTSGIEFLGTHRIPLAADRFLGLEAGYTWIRTSAETGKVSKYIANHPSHQLSFGLRASVRDLMIHSQTEYRVRSGETAPAIGAEVPGSYLVTHLNVEYALSGSVILYSQVQNLTDTRYQEILGPPMPGRWIMGGVRLQVR